MTRVSRRRLLGTGALTAAGAVVSAAAAPSAAARTAPTTADVVVVGAGLSGLTTARDLVAAGRSVIVLEARGRPGGRVYGLPVGDGTTSEGGAEFIGPTQDRIAALTRDMGVETFKTYNTGKNVYYRNGKRSLYETGGILGGGAARLGRHRPADRAAEARRNDQGRAGRRAVEGSEGRGVGRLDVLHLVAVEFAEQRRAVTDGRVRLLDAVDALAGGVAAPPAALRRRCGQREHPGHDRPADQHQGRRAGVQDGITVSARRVVVAMSPAIAGKIDYSPALPASRAQLMQRYPMGSIAKFIGVYDTPFWRADGLTGQAIADSGAIDATFDNSPPDGSRGILMGFINQANIRKLDGAPESEVRAAGLAAFTKLFGDRAATPRITAIQRWDNETWSGGGPTGIAPPGALTAFGPALRAPCGPVHWAGTETSGYWTGYMDGAVRSGERVAREVHAAL